MAMKQLDALRICKNKPYYSAELYLTTWDERSGTRHCILTPDSIVGWGFTWEKAIADADKQYAAKSAA